jgi:hypothetical protein
MAFEHRLTTTGCQGFERKKELALVREAQACTKNGACFLSERFLFSLIIIIIIIINMLMSVNCIVLHFKEPFWYSMTAALLAQSADVPVSRWPSQQMSQSADVPVSRCPSQQMSQSADVPVSRCPSQQMTQSADGPVSRCPSQQMTQSADGPVS